MQTEDGIKCLRAHTTSTCQKKLMALHATNAPDAVTVPWITKIRQRDIDKILEMHQFKTQAKKPQSQHSRKRNVLTICPVQLLKIKDKDGKALATLDSSSNTSFISKNVAKKLGIRGYKTHLKINLAGSQKKSEETELIDLAVSSTVEQNGQKSLQANEIKNLCSPARTVSRTVLESWPLKIHHEQFASIRRNIIRNDWHGLCTGFQWYAHDVREK